MFGIANSNLKVVSSVAVIIIVLNEFLSESTLLSPPEFIYKQLVGIVDP